MSETYKQIVGGNPKRLEALSDGVFAIAMTLLVLDLRVPLRDEIHSELELFHSFLALAPRLLSYLLGMITLGIYWTGNATLLGLIDRSERNFTWITIFFLLTISLIPFSTAFLGEFIDFKFAVGIYGLNLVLLGLVSYASWAYAERHGLVRLAGEAGETLCRTVRRRIVVNHAPYTAGALSCVINTYLSIFFIIGVQLSMVFVFNPRTNKADRKA